MTAGTYDVALVAGPETLTSFGATNWNVTTTGSYPITFDEYFEVSFSIGNTTPFPIPVNDECAGAIVVSESSPPRSKVWTGDNVGATNSLATPCYPIPDPALQPRDVWFAYTSTQTGRALIEAYGGAGGAATPILGAYADCVGSLLRCMGTGRS